MKRKIIFLAGTRFTSDELLHGILMLPENEQKLICDLLVRSQAKYLFRFRYKRTEYVLDLSRIAYIRIEKGAVLVHDPDDKMSARIPKMTLNQMAALLAKAGYPENPFLKLRSEILFKIWFDELPAAAEVRCIHIQSFVEKSYHKTFGKKTIKQIQMWLISDFLSC